MVISHVHSLFGLDSFFLFLDLPFPRRRIPHYTQGRPPFVHHWGPYENDMTLMAKTILHAVRHGLRRLWWENHHNNICPFDSNIISLINKVIHDNRLKRNFLDTNYWFFDGTWINGLWILNGYLSAREFEIVWSDRSRLPRYLLEEEEDIKFDYAQYAAQGFYYHC